MAQKNQNVLNHDCVKMNFDCYYSEGHSFVFKISYFSVFIFQKHKYPNENDTFTFLKFLNLGIFLI